MRKGDWVLCVLLCALTTGCYGREERTAEEVVAEVDANGDGKVNAAEWKASKYDTNGDGVPQTDEMVAAMEPKAESPLLGILETAFDWSGVPLLAVAANAIRTGRKHRKHVRVLVEGVEGFVKGSDGSVKERLYGALRVAADTRLRASAVTLAREVATIKAQIRSTKDVK